MFKINFFSSTFQMKTGYWVLPGQIHIRPWLPYFILQGGIMASESFLGEVKLFCGSFAPLGWAFCDGSYLSVAEYSALFSIIGNAFGGDGMSNFALPDFRGRVPLSAGSGKDLTPKAVGQMGGHETMSLDNDASEGQTEVKMTLDSKDGQAVSIMQPWLCANFIICIDGMYPPRH